MFTKSLSVFIDYRISCMCITVLVFGSFAGGLIGGILWLVFWWYVGVPVLSVLLGGLCCGFLLAAIIFNLTPLGKFILLSSIPIITLETFR